MALAFGIPQAGRTSNCNLTCNWFKRFSFQNHNTLSQCYRGDRSALTGISGKSRMYCSRPLPSLSQTFYQVRIAQEQDARAERARQQHRVSSGSCSFMATKSDDGRESAVILARKDQPNYKSTCPPRAVVWNIKLISTGLLTADSWPPSAMSRIKTGHQAAGVKNSRLGGPAACQHSTSQML